MSMSFSLYSLVVRVLLRVNEDTESSSFSFGDSLEGTDISTTFLFLLFHFITDIHFYTFLINFKFGFVRFTNGKCFLFIESENYYICKYNKSHDCRIVFTISLSKSELLFLSANIALV